MNPLNENKTNEIDFVSLFVEMNRKLDKLINDKSNTVRPKLLSLSETAKYLNMSRSKLTGLQKEKLIEMPSKIGGNYFYEIAYLDFFIEKNRPVSYQVIAEAISKSLLGLNDRKAVFKY